MRSLICTFLVIISAQAKAEEAQSLVWFAESVEESAPTAVDVISWQGNAQKDNVWRLNITGRSPDAIQVADFMATLQAVANRKFKTGICKQNIAAYKLKKTGHFDISIDCKLDQKEADLKAAAMTYPGIELVLHRLVTSTRAEGLRLNQLTNTDRQDDLVFTSSKSITPSSIQMIIQMAPLAWQSAKLEVIGSNKCLVKGKNGASKLSLSAKKSSAVAH